jgi:hypothetical protein
MLREITNFVVWVLLLAVGLPMFFLTGNASWLADE